MKNIDFIRNLTFGYLTSQRLLPNYIYFSQVYNFGDSTVLKQYLQLIRSKIIDQNFESNFGDYETILNKLSPEPHNYKTVLASSAMDACGSVYSLINYIIDKNDNHIQEIATLATDSVDMYIQEKENLDMSNPQMEKIIAEHPLMVKERKTQENILNYLNKMNIVEAKDLEMLEQLQYNNGRGNLELLL